MPSYVFLTPFWFRLFIAALVVVAAVLVSLASTYALFGPGGGGLRLAAAAALAVILCGMALRVCDPLDRPKWFRFAITRDGFYFPGRGSSLVFVPWSALVALHVERWYGKGEHSAARLTLDLDDECWSRFGRGHRIEGTGRVRRVRVQVVDMTGDEIVARIKACRADSPVPRD